MDYKITGYEPAQLFHFFEEVSAIPRGSGNEKGISDFLVAFAKERGLDVYQDEVYNVIIRKPASAGAENAPTVMLQGHIDMVCDKLGSVEHDFTTDGIDLVVKDGVLTANGTTLGADNGIAVALMLTVLDDDSIIHPALECVFTTDEETGLVGAETLDKSQISARTMINLDSEEEGVATVSCAGGVVVTYTCPIVREHKTGSTLTLDISGLLGGHSGSDIHLERGNGNLIMARIIDRLMVAGEPAIVSFNGGTKDNAIPRSCQATLVAMGIQLERINAVAEELQAEVREKYDEPDAVIQAFDVDALGGNGLSTQATAKVIGLLCAAPNGVQARSQDIDGLVQTSLNMGITKLGERFNVTFSVRSSVNSEKEELLEKLKDLAEFFEGNYSQSGEYPAWEFRKDSVLRDTMVRLYREMFGKEPQVLAIHAGLECGLLGEKLPGLDCVSIGPQMHDIHTSREKLDIASTERTWKFLLEVLKNL